MSDSSEEENEFMGDGDDFKQDVNEAPMEKRRSSKKSISYKDDDGNVEMEDNDDDSDDDNSDDDDIPLAKLVKKKPAAAKNGKKSNGKTTATKRKTSESNSSSKKRPSTPKKNKASSSTAVTTNSNKSYEYPSAALYGTECEKGLLIQRLLCRWWYAYDWPTNIPDTAPDAYDALEGFPGVFVCTGAGHADVGKIMDRRDHGTAPTFRNFARKSADELRELLIKALTEQMKQLDENDTITRKQLTGMLKWAKAMDTSKADKNAIKILKAHSLWEGS